MNVSFESIPEKVSQLATALIQARVSDPFFAPAIGMQDPFVGIIEILHKFRNYVFDLGAGLAALDAGIVANDKYTLLFGSGGVTFGRMVVLLKGEQLVEQSIGGAQIARMINNSVIYLNQTFAGEQGDLLLRTTMLMPFRYYFLQLVQSNKRTILPMFPESGFLGVDNETIYDEAEFLQRIQTAYNSTLPELERGYA